ncbi:RNA methyltransferase [Hydrogenophaga crassostreae]|uniref:RNA methyltransferase n=1 Tax=Hydrogenophaga crassostreae TaxID=1763535 RepID=A0A162Z463_9BURK|nr:TfoX/Sxy family protein [Hydrogenophaga crassostreae]AOW14402.1 RNA methyltransferase [Hydrogenophaga crassostreae]OAD43573.1 RNA methyltransferase [Hydrogenophaga crassostreae]
MAFDPGLAQRIREILGNRPGLSERRMFGGLAFLIHGHMFAGVQEGTLMARVGPGRYADALTLKHVRMMDFTGKPLKGYVYVDPAGIEEDAQLAKWLTWCAGVVAAMPPKKAKK